MTVGQRKQLIIENSLGLSENIMILRLRVADGRSIVRKGHKPLENFEIFVHDGNVLLGLLDGVAVVRLPDFGLNQLLLLFLVNLLPLCKGNASINQ